MINTLRCLIYYFVCFRTVFFNSFAMINSYEFNINFALFLSLHFWWQEMKVNWATSPGNAPKQDTSSKSHLSWLFYFFLFRITHNVFLSFFFIFFFIRWIREAPFLSESFISFFFAVVVIYLFPCCDWTFSLFFFYSRLFMCLNRPPSQRAPAEGGPVGQQLDVASPGVRCICHGNWLLSSSFFCFLFFLVLQGSVLHIRMLPRAFLKWKGEKWN